MSYSCFRIVWWQFTFSYLLTYPSIVNLASFLSFHDNIELTTLSRNKKYLWNYNLNSSRIHQKLLHHPQQKLLQICWRYRRDFQKYFCYMRVCNEISETRATQLSMSFVNTVIYHRPFYFSRQGESFNEYHVCWEYYRTNLVQEVHVRLYLVCSKS